MSTDIAYLAGILDGEGSFSVVHTRGSGYANVIQVTVTHKPLIDWLYQTFGGHTTSQPSIGNREATYYWRLAAKPAIRKLLPFVIPYLKVKFLQASILLDFCQRFNVGSGSSYSVEQLEEMDRYCRLSLLANSSGPGSNDLKARILSVVTNKDNNDAQTQGNDNSNTGS